MSTNLWVQLNRKVKTAVLSNGWQAQECRFMCIKIPVTVFPVIDTAWCTSVNCKLVIMLQLELILHKVRCS